MKVNEAFENLGKAQTQLIRLAEFLKVLELAAISQQENSAVSLDWISLVEISKNQLAETMPLLEPAEVFLRKEALG